MTVSHPVRITEDFPSGPVRVINLQEIVDYIRYHSDAFDTFVTLKAHRITEYEFTAPNVWEDIAFEDLVESETTPGFKFLDETMIEIVSECKGMYKVSGCVRPLWSGVAATQALLATRIVVSDDDGDTWVESRCLQSVNSRAFQTAEVGTQHYLGSVKVVEGTRFKLQAQVSNLDMSLAGWGGFDRPTSASLLIYGVGDL